MRQRGTISPTNQNNKERQVFKPDALNQGF